MADEQNINSSDETTEPAKPSEKRALPPLQSAAGNRPRTPLPPIQPRGAATTAVPATPVMPSAPVQSAATASIVTPSPVIAATPLAKPATPTSRTVKPKQDKPPEDDPGIWRMSRKNFMNVAGWAAFFGFLGTATVGAIRLMVPRVLYEQPSAFKAGFPSDYIVGEVNEKYKDEYRVWIVREPDGFYALLAICTHLGCTPRWLPTESKFKCPCHGSGYHKDGVNFEGPTPRPLERLKITLADDGQILVDRAVKFLYEKQEWTKPEAFLKYS
jgi:cytochrome b6-f complex iron-sulfur subunit